MAGRRSPTPDFMAARCRGGSAGLSWLAVSVPGKMGCLNGDIARLKVCLVIYIYIYYKYNICFLFITIQYIVLSLFLWGIIDACMRFCKSIEL